MCLIKPCARFRSSTALWISRDFAAAPYRKRLSGIHIGLREKLPVDFPGQAGETTRRKREKLPVETDLSTGFQGEREKLPVAQRLKLPAPLSL